MTGLLAPHGGRAEHAEANSSPSLRIGDPKPTFLPLMKRPVRSVEKDNAEKEMRDLLERTRLMLRGG